MSAALFGVVNSNAAIVARIEATASRQAGFSASAGADRMAFMLAILAMAAVVTACKLLVHHPIRQFGLADFAVRLVIAQAA